MSKLALRVIAGLSQAAGAYHTPRHYISGKRYYYLGRQYLLKAMEAARLGSER
jgi:hypothetical protein